MTRRVKGKGRGKRRPAQQQDRTTTQQPEQQDRPSSLDRAQDQADQDRASHRKRLGEIVRHPRALSGKTRGRLAQLLHWPDATVYRLEHGQHQLTAGQWGKLCAMLPDLGKWVGQEAVVVELVPESPQDPQAGDPGAGGTARSVTGTGERDSSASDGEADLSVRSASSASNDALVQPDRAAQDRGSEPSGTRASAQSAQDDEDDGEPAGPSGELGRGST